MTSTPSMHERLRAATMASHQRLHRHEGFGAAASGTIAHDDYRLLLMRLYGFYRAFEENFAEALPSFGFADGSRSQLIIRDVEALGVDRGTVALLPLCSTVPARSNDAAALGALYVVEGSSLGGVHIARALEPVARDARSFFLSGIARRRAWPSLLARIEILASDSSQASCVIDSAIRTFAAFEQWMQDWRSAPTLCTSAGPSVNPV